MNEALKLASYLKAVAQQKLVMEPWLEDREFATRGGNVLYAVDADIVKLYTAPQQQAVSSKNRKKRGYAQIFPGDEATLSIAIGRALGDYIFNKLNIGDCPLLVIPPIDQEIRNIYNAIAKDAENEHTEGNKEITALASTLKKLNNETNDLTIYNELQKAVPQLIVILSDFGNIAEFTRLSYLLTKTRIAPPEYLLKNNLITNDIVRSALTPIDNVSGWIKFNLLYEEWLERLKKAKSERYADLIERDAMAMARLEWINNHLDEKHRLVYITGDPSLHKATNEYFQPNQTNSFAFRFLRHPRAYLAEPNVIYPNTCQHDVAVTASSEFLELLDTFLAKFELGGLNSNKIRDELSTYSDSRLAALVRPVLNSTSNAADNFQDKWENFTKNLVLSYSSIETPEKKLNKTISMLNTDIEALTTRVKLILNEKLSESWEAFFGAVTTTAYGLLYDKKPSAYIPRSAPPLKFSSLGKAQEFVKKVLDSHKIGTLDSEEYRNLIYELNNEDESGYSFYLAYALLFAAEGAWHASSILAARAIDISGRTQQLNISGREATYLRAVALRHCARNIEDLTKPLMLLDEAEACLQNDRKKRGDSLKGGEIRFTAERLAIELCYNMFSFFLKAPLPDNVLNLQSLQVKVENLLNDLDSVEEDAWVIRNVERTLLSILFMSMFIRSKEDKMLIDGTSKRHYFERLRKNKNSDVTKKISVPFQVQAICLAAGWWTSNDPVEKSKYKERLWEHLTDNNITTMSVFPFDEKRFRFLKNFVAD